MSLQTVSSLVKQIKTDLEQAADLCKEIKKTRHVGHEHHALDALEASLLDGPSFVEHEYDNAKDVEGHETTLTALQISIQQLKEISTRLQTIAHPPTHNPHHHHRHDDEHHAHHHHSKEKEDPHFRDLQLKWETIRDGLTETLARASAREKKSETEAEVEVHVEVVGKEEIQHSREVSPKTSIVEVEVEEVVSYG